MKFFKRCQQPLYLTSVPFAYVFYIQGEQTKMLNLLFDVICSNKCISNMLTVVVCPFVACVLCIDILPSCLDGRVSQTLRFQYLLTLVNCFQIYFQMY